MPTVVIADDEEFVRYFLKSVMESLSFEVVAEVEKGDDLPDVIEDKQPDILLLDINMPNLTGMEFLEQYANQFPKTCIIILTSASSAKLALEAQAEGVSCFLRKDISLDEMIASIQDAWANFQLEKGL